jgi:hypothetical protein
MAACVGVVAAVLVGVGVAFVVGALILVVFRGVSGKMEL